ncbi:hypothetical protein [Piscirickettsia litoralis]|uniref:Uncharacterized protein n=1 Tax=Piscirickettsia litoralis TaxID=1891921 RepID=A0ABX2ZXY5_9GAMM|nr:hypothetical protein [Piscirickettsia litoralis]ODN41476.1 hypothetical protein BGC07_15285 [Piscirickettsia litoralis]
MPSTITHIIDQNKKPSNSDVKLFFHHINQLAHELTSGNCINENQSEAVLKLLFLYDPINFCVSEVLTIALWETQEFIKPNKEYLEFSLSGLTIKNLH